MRFTSTQENDTVLALVEDPDQHLVFDPADYEREDAIRIHRDGLRYSMTRYLFEVIYEREPVGYLLRSCDQPGCQNPHHYHESASPRPATKPKKNPGGPNGAAINRAKKLCPAGHRYTPENTYISTDKYGTHRKCVKCTKERVRQSRSHNRRTAA